MIEDVKKAVDPERLKRVLEGSEKVYSGVRFDIHRMVLPGRDGKEHVREVVAHPGAVVILPFLENGDVVLIRNERFAVGEALWELPAGTLEPNEAPQYTAERELQEETGYRAEVVTPLHQFYTSPGICNEGMYAFVAEGLSHVGQSLDDGEEIEVETFPMAKVQQMVREGVIRDGKTIAAFLYYCTFFQDVS